MDSVDIGDDAAARNDSLIKRRFIARQSREFDMGRLHADISFYRRYMLNEVGVTVKLVRSKNAFCVMGNAKVVITHASLFVRKSVNSCRRFFLHMPRLCEIYDKACGVQVVCCSSALSGCESREIILWSAAYTRRHRSRN